MVAICCHCPYDVRAFNNFCTPRTSATNGLIEPPLESAGLSGKNHMKIRMNAFVVLVAGLLVADFVGARKTASAADSLRVGVAEADITPPVGFPDGGLLSRAIGRRHDRSAQGQGDRVSRCTRGIRARRVRFDRDRNGPVPCDSQTSVREDRHPGLAHRGLGNALAHRTRLHEGTVLEARWREAASLRAEYIDKLINGPVEAIVKAHAAAKPAKLEFGSASQTMPVSFNRRSVMRDGSVKTWQSFDNPNVARAAGPIDPEIALLTVRDEAGKPLGILSNSRAAPRHPRRDEVERRLTRSSSNRPAQSVRPRGDLDLWYRLLRRHQSRQPTQQGSQQDRPDRQFDR